jgi:AcrR family transcriptional regulator
MVRENKKRSQVMLAARRLFWKHGLKRVSVEEICQEACVSKMTFYKHFANKTDLAKQILDLVFTESMAEYNRIMQSDQPYTEKVRQSIAFKLQTTKDVSQELINELYKSGDAEIMSYVQQGAENAMKVFISDLILLREKGEIRGELNPEFLVYMLRKLTEMTTEEEFVKLFNNPEDMIRTITGFFFYGIMPPAEKQNR